MTSPVNDLITREIVAFVEDARKSAAFRTRWQKPLTAFADARDPLFGHLREWVSPDHAMPHDLLPGAGSVTAYFLPFERDIPRSNSKSGRASKQWAIAYVETNALITSLNAHLTRVLRSRGLSTAEIPPTHNFDLKRLVSHWSHRHVAWIAGLGTFGVHRMLITEKGCCGRLGSLVISGECEPTGRPGYEFCLQKHGRACLACVKKCPSGALHEHSFDRRLCYSILLENARVHEKTGLADVCGKCLSTVPCSHTNPAGRAAYPLEAGGKGSGKA
jgi:epoxyqueuosine reductase QueG